MEYEVRIGGAPTPFQNIARYHFVEIVTRRSLADAHQMGVLLSRDAPVFLNVRDGAALAFGQPA